MASSATWPDPNSPVLAKIDFGISVGVVLQWLQIRDTLVGENETFHDLDSAVALARDCKHPDAVWLVSILEGKEISTKEEAREKLLLEKDPRALCLAWWLMDEDVRVVNMSLLCRGAEKGDAFACSTLCGEDRFQNRTRTFHLAQLAASQHERDGFYWLGACFYYGVGCEQDLSAAKENFLIAAELGYLKAAKSYGDLLEETDPEFWTWRSRKALHGDPDWFLSSMLKQVSDYFSGAGSASVVFLIGRELKGNIEVERRKIFRCSCNFSFFVSPARQAVSFYEAQVRCARLAINTWVLVGTRFGIAKDVRKIIGNLIWDARFEAKYDLKK